MWDNKKLERTKKISIAFCEIIDLSFRKEILETTKAG